MLCPQERDFRAIRAAGLDPRYRVRFAGADLDELDSFDPEALLAEFAELSAGGAARPPGRCAVPTTPPPPGRRGRGPPRAGRGVWSFSPPPRRRSHRPG